MIIKEQTTPTKTEGKITPSIIIEGAIFDVPERYKKYTDGKIVFEAYLQSANTKNQNRRIYPKTVLDQGMKMIQEKIDRRKFLGEMDHPISDNQQRACTVLYKECSHLVREWCWEGDRIKGVCETLPYMQHGRELTGLICDKIPIGFSLRACGEVQDVGGVQYIQSPLVIFSYDSVTEPSHVGSEICEIRQEGKVTKLTESKGLKILEEAKNFYKLSDGNTYSGNALDYFVENKIVKMMKKFTMI